MKASFNEIMASVAGQAGLDGLAELNASKLPREKIAARTAQPDPAQVIADTAQLSVRGARALGGPVARDRPDPPAIRDDLRSDLQGNRVVISGTGQSLAKTRANDVAWETKL